MRIFPPLKDGHPLLDRMCGLCAHPFHAGERAALVAVPVILESGNERAIPVHARCAYNGAVTPQGIVTNIKDGDASPFPVVTNLGQFKFSELGIEE